MASLHYQFTADSSAIQRAFRDVATAAKQSAAQVAKSAEQQSRAQQKASDKAANEAKKAEEKRWREAEKTGAKIARELQKEEQARVRAEQRANAKILAERQALFRKAGSLSTSALKGAAGGIGIGAALSAAGLASTALGGVGQAAREGLALRAQANRISVMGHRAGGEFMDPAKITGALERTAIANPGTNASELGEGLAELVSHTGDIKGSIEQLDTLAIATQALGGDAKDTAKVMIALQRSFGIDDAEQLKDALASLSATTKSAGVPVEALESHVLSLAATASRFGYKGVAGVKETGGLLALATKGVGDPARAEKSAVRFMDRVTENSAHLNALGVHTRDKSGAMLPMQQIVSNLISGLGGHSMSAMRAELTKTLGGGEKGGIGTIGAAISTYEQKFNETKGSDQEKQRAATEALNDELSKLMGTTADYRNLQAEAGQIQQSAGAQASLAWQKLAADVNEKIVPALIPFLERLPDTFDTAIDPAIDALGALADAIEATVKVLPELGIGHESTRGQQRELEKNIKHIEDRIVESGAPSPKMLELRDKYKAELERLRGGGGPLQGGGVFESVHKAFTEGMVSAEPQDWFKSAKHEHVSAAKALGIDPLNPTRQSAGDAKNIGSDDVTGQKVAGHMEKLVAHAEKAALATKMGADAAAKMAEKLGDASRNLPLSAR